jgi:hypothetical protein
MESAKPDGGYGPVVPAAGELALDNADKALDNQRRHSESISPTSRLDNRTEGSGNGEASRMEHGKKKLIQRPRHGRMKTDGSFVDPEKSPGLKHAATSRSSVDSVSRWAIVRYGENLEDCHADPGNWDEALVKKMSINSFNAGLHLAAKRGETRLARYCLS